MAEEKHLRDMRTVWWQEDASGEAVCMIDQSLLPGQIVNLTLTHVQQVAEAISTLKVRRANYALSEHCSFPHLAQIWRDEAQAIADEDFQACLNMGRYGAELIADDDILLTHCNAGFLATAGWGTALAPMYVAHRAGKHLHVFVDETRPVLQGARLTAWELQQEGISLTLITDNMVGHFMHCGDIKAVFVGTDRIATNGDMANKIDTYGIAVLAQAP